MDINYEMMQYFILNKIVGDEQAKIVCDECARLHMPVETYMVSKGYCSEAEALSVLGEYMGIPYCEMDMLAVDRKVLKKFSFTFLRKHKFVPVTIDKNGVMLVAIARPLDFNATSMLSQLYVGPLDFILVPSEQIDAFLDSVASESAAENVVNDLLCVEGKDNFAAAMGRAFSPMTKEEDVINSPAVRFVDSILKEAAFLRASDIHIEPFEKMAIVRFRIDGELKEHAEIPDGCYPAVCARLKILSGISIVERRIPQDGRMRMERNGVVYDYRVSALPTVFGEKFMIRVLDHSIFEMTRSELGFTEEDILSIDKIFARSYGLVLLTGPTGCGKSTTLYSFLKELNQPNINIVTVEDPVEYTMRGVNQVQVNPKVDLTFSAALRSVLRQDPDVIMVGEIRDEATAEIAVRAAITGHLVFSTLHTKEAAGAIARLSDLKVPRYLVADALDCVIAQRLVKRLCPVCKIRSETSLTEMKILGLNDPVSVYRKKGCRFCGNTGYRGRIAVYEIMYMSDSMKGAVIAGKSTAELRAIAEREGMKNLWENGKKIVFDGITDIRELMGLYDSSIN